MNDMAVQDNHSVGLTISAAERINTLIEMEGNPELNFRISITGGGCSGFSYHFDLDDKVNDDDLTFDLHGVKVVVDKVSIDLVDGSQVDYVEDMMGASFQIKNPNASSTCGCGSSFSV